MHLLVAQAGAAHEPDEAVDLGQDPAELVVLSAADTELAVLAAARRTMADAPTLRLANLAALAHPMSVDVWAQGTAARSGAIVVRVLGGHAYWSYGLEKLHEVALAKGIPFCALPGDAKLDPSLDRFCTVSREVRDRLWSYLVEGGPDNAERFLTLGRALSRDASLEAPEAVPLLKAGVLEEARGEWVARGPVCAVTFYRALVQAGNTEVVADLCDALRERGLNPLPIYVSSLKDEVSQTVIRRAFAADPPAVVVNLTGFAVSSPDGSTTGTVLDEGGAVVLQAVLASGERAAWEGSTRGLGARDLAMNVALTEIDGRVLSRAVAFKDSSAHDEDVQANIVRHVAVPDRVAFVAGLAAAWARLRATPTPKRRVALVLANYPNRDGRIGNGVGLDTPAATATALRAMREAGYATGDAPEDGSALLAHLLAGPTNAADPDREVRETLSLSDYRAFLATLPVQVQGEVRERWGEPEADPFVRDGRFALPLSRFGHVTVGVQPARGYNIDPKETYHAPDLVPPHGYLAFYAWLRREGIHAVVHMGKHGNMEWLPGKALALSKACYPEAAFGSTPHLYPFIVNDPGEGSQAKRRAQAVIVDHLTPPLTRAETYGALRQLEALVDEYFEAAGIDPRRLRLLKRDILDLVRETGLDHDAGIGEGDLDEDALAKLDTYLCELKEMQIRDGLHVFGVAPEGRLADDLTVALARVPRGLGRGGDASLHRVIAADLALGFDPLECAMGERWTGERPVALADIDSSPWRTFGDTVERIELLASALVQGDTEPGDWPNVRAVLTDIRERLRPAVEGCGEAELIGLLRGLDGRFVPPGPSGAPTRGRADVLPTGRNFFSVDCRAVPTPAAWELGRKSAELLVIRHMQDHGDDLTAIGLSVWGTSNMRTGGDDIAQAMALLGVEPVWDHASRRVTGFNVIPPAKLGRPRVDVTLRVSGFFRDAFPAQMDLFDRAVRAVAELDEDAEDNPVRARIEAEAAALAARGVSDAKRRASYRVFGSKPGAYGAGLQALMDEGGWTDTADLAEAYIAWGGYAYGAEREGEAQHERLRERLAGVQAVVHNQDNREHDLLDSDDYYQFEGGMTAAVEHERGARPAVYHNDHSRPERPVVRTLEEEIARVVRARVVNPKWIAGVMRHGYKGAFEIAATVDYLFAFSATTGAVRGHHFDAVHDAYLGDEAVRTFMAEHNPHALRELADRLLEAQERGLWRARSNSARGVLEELAEREGAA